jgi:NAD-dependent SIR2 family protein deacetylase
VPYPAPDTPGTFGEPDLAALVALLHPRRTVVLAGAGMSTESGIPDYRGPETARRARNPIQYRQFMDSAAARARYWARSVLGFSRMSAARPNPAHRALAALEHSGHLAGIITQNVDGLHHAAGNRRVIELHGSIARVRCVDCGARESRAALQERLLAANPGWDAQTAAIAPDGDADLDPDRIAAFRVVGCLPCGGVLKPDVVFFGENVPKHVTDEAWTLFDEAEVLLVVGSSLTVFSGYRFVRRAAERSIPVAIVNLGPTRGDEHAALRVDARLGDLLPRLAARLSDARST